MKPVKLRRVRASLLLAVAGWMLATTILPASAETTGVRTTKAIEILPVPGSTFLAWTQAPASHPKRLAVFAKRRGGSRFRVSARGAKGFTAGGAMDGSRLIYSQRRRNRANLKLIDLSTRNRSALPAAINTRKHEWGASLSGDWVLFARTTFSSSTERVFLFNIATKQKRLLAETRGRAYSQPGSVSGNYASWIRCRRFSTCRAFRYDIAARTKTKIVNPNSKAQYATSVTSDGTVYYAESNNIATCSSRVNVYRKRLGAARTKLFSLRRGRDVSSTGALVADSNTSLYFDRFICRTGAADILKTNG
ncbi:MAG: hypothetical protein ACRDI3_03000 [Actinomycetota bacterium]